MQHVVFPDSHQSRHLASMTYHGLQIAASVDLWESHAPSQGGGVFQTMPPAICLVGLSTLKQLYYLILAHSFIIGMLLGTA